MSRILSRPRIRDGLFAAGILLMLTALILMPEQSVSAARDGLSLCANVILPSLFPFFVLSTLSVDLGLIRYAGKLTQKLMYPLFHVNGSCSGAFLLGIVGGYPVGARTAIELYQSRQCSRVEAERMLSFCNNSGPAFILGVVGAGIFSSSKAGLLLYGAHVAASVVVGMLFRFYRNDSGTSPIPAESQEHTMGFAEAFTGAVKNALYATLNISSFVIFFTVLIRLLFRAGVIGGLAGLLNSLAQGYGMSTQMAESLITGLIEMTSGVWSLRDTAAAMGDQLCMAAFILGWAGLSVHCQVLSFIGSTGLSTKTYFLGKLLHGLISAGLIYGYYRLFGETIPVSAYLATQVRAIAGLHFTRALMVSVCAALSVFLFLVLISPDYFKKRYGNRR